MVRVHVKPPLALRATAIGVVFLLIGALSLAGCRPLASEEALEWCSLHQTRVARAALDHGLMDRGTDFTDWKLSDTDGYNRACMSAFEEEFG